MPLPPSNLFSIDLFVTPEMVPGVQDALAPFCVSLAAFEVEKTPLWHVSGVAQREPDRGAVMASVAIACARAGVGVPDVCINPLPAVDWLAENRRSFPPIHAGRFFVYGEYYEGKVPAGGLGIFLDAGPAFGSGTHQTTQGCLRAIDWLQRTQPRPRRMLDLGCGSGILAIGMAKLHRKPVFASDIDPIAVRTTYENAARNDVSALLRAATGPDLQAVPAHLQFDLVAANILAKPLRDIARPLARRVTPGGNLILSGLLKTQATELIAVFGKQGLRLMRRFDLGEWSTLAMRK